MEVFSISYDNHTSYLLLIDWFASLARLPEKDSLTSSNGVGIP